MRNGERERERIVFLRKKERIEGGGGRGVTMQKREGYKGERRKERG